MNDNISDFFTLDESNNQIEEARRIFAENGEYIVEECKTFQEDHDILKKFKTPQDAAEYQMTIAGEIISNIEKSTKGKCIVYGGAVEKWQQLLPSESVNFMVFVGNDLWAEDKVEGILDIKVKMLSSERSIFSKCFEVNYKGIQAILQFVKSGSFVPTEKTTFKDLVKFATDSAVMVDFNKIFYNGSVFEATDAYTEEKTKGTITGNLAAINSYDDLEVFIRDVIGYAVANPKKELRIVGESMQKDFFEQAFIAITNCRRLIQEKEEKERSAKK